MQKIVKQTLLPDLFHFELYLISNKLNRYKITKKRQAQDAHIEHKLIDTLLHHYVKDIHTNLGNAPIFTTFDTEIRSKLLKATDIADIYNLQNELAHSDTIYTSGDINTLIDLALKQF